MNSGELFPDKSDIKPIIYAYELVGVESHTGYIKVGETTRSAAERIREQTHTVAVQFRVLGTWSALRDDGTVFRDHDVRAVLLKRGFAQLNEGEDLCIYRLFGKGFLSGMSNPTVEFLQGAFR